MAKFSVLGGATSQSDVIFIQDSSSTTGAGLSGLAFNTSGLTAYYSFAGANATATAITLATLAAVNSAWSSGGFKEIDATNMKGWYRFDIPNAAIATAKGRIVGIHFQGATNMAPCAVAYELTGWDNQDAVRGGMTALPNAAANAAGGLPISAAGALDLDEMNVDIEAIQTSTAGLTFTGAGKVDASVRDWIGGTIPAVNVTGVPLVDLKYTLGTVSPAAAGSVGIDWAQVANKGSTVSLTATTIATTTTVTNQLTAAAVATGVWQDATAGDFTAALSVGKSVMNGVALGTGLTVNSLTNLPSIPANWLTAAGINAAALNGKGDWMVSYTQPTGFLAATFPSGTVANTTNITSITGNITGNLSGSVGSVTARVTANTDQINGNATAAANLEENVENCPRGTCSGGTNTTAVVSSMTTPASLTAAGQLVGRTIVFDWDTTTAALQGQASNITNSTTGATPTITFGALTAGTVPANGDTFSIV